jgi:hypothetical protein
MDLPLLRRPSATRSERSGARSPNVIEEFLYRNANVLDDLSQERRRDVPAWMERNRCTSSIGVPELAVRAALANLNEAKTL